MQKGFDDPRWGRRNNPQCEENIARLLAHWRASARTVIFVRHDSTEPGSPLAPGSSGNDFKAVVTGEPDLLVTKSVNSAFYGDPDLEAWLRAADLTTLVIAGITTNHCCETTARMAGNLGFTTLFALDATHTFDRIGPDGQTVSAECLAHVTATNLEKEFAAVVSTDQMLDDA